MNNNLDKLQQVPASAFKEVTEPIPGTNGTPGTAGTPGTGFIDETEALKGAEHTKISPLQLNPGNTPQNALNTGFPGQSPQSVSLGAMIDGKLAIELMDALIPGLLVAALHSVSISMRKSELQLTESEKKTLVPIFHECLKTINLNFSNPWTMLGVTIGVIYGSKVTEKGIIAWIDKKNEQAELAATVIEPAKTSVQPSQQPAQMTVTPSPVQQSPGIKRPSTEAEIFESIIAETFLEKGLQPLKLKFTEQQIKDKVSRKRTSRKGAVKMLTIDYIKKAGK